MLLRLCLLTGALLPTLSGPALTDEAPPPDVEIERAIAVAVEAALGRDPRVSAFDVSVSVFGDKVTLEGVVGSLAARRAVAADARNTVGVRRLANLIKVRREPEFADEVRVSVEDGVATLCGTVSSWLEAGAARDNAYDGGAIQVVNRLTIEADGASQADS